MTHARVAVAIATALIGFAAPAAQARPAPDPKAGVLVNTWHNGPTVHSGDWYWPDALFMYEAAMDGRFGPIETRIGDGTGPTPFEVVRRWERVDDFATCAQAAEVPATPLSRAPVILLEPRARDLLVGRCVVGRLVPAVTAQYEADHLVTNAFGVELTGLDAFGETPKGLVLREGRDRRRVVTARDTAKAYATIWALFGLTGPQRGQDLGPAVDDDALIRGLTATPELRRAAFEEIRRRWATGEPTSRRVGESLARSGLLQAEAPHLRAEAMRVAGRIPAAADLLLPEILAGLTAPAEPIRATEMRMDAEARGETFDLAAEKLDAKWMRPGGRHPMIAPAAALAAARFGPDALAQVWPHVEARALEELADATGDDDDEAFVTALNGLCVADSRRLADLAAAHPELAALRAAADACRTAAD